jgi:CRISPR-associated protein Cas2
MGWMIVMFDLPTVEREEQRRATKFRTGLLELGYFMLQESVYVRNCVSLEKYEQHLGNVTDLAPNKGLINVFFITNRQWLDSKTLCLQSIKPKSKRAKPAGEEAAKQMTFW